MGRKGSSVENFVTGVIHISLNKIYDMSLEELTAYVDVEFETVKMALITSLAQQGYGNAYYDIRLQPFVDSDVRNRN